MGTLILPTAGSVYVDANVVIYAVEKVEPYKALLDPLWLAAGCALFLSNDTAFTRVPGLPVTILSRAIAG